MSCLGISACAKPGATTGVETGVVCSDAGSEYGEESVMSLSSLSNAPFNSSALAGLDTGASINEPGAPPRKKDQPD